VALAVGRGTDYRQQMSSVSEAVSAGSNEAREGYRECRR
jgi:hypothetical protein